MNNFNGKISLLEGIAIDLFTSKVLDATVYFLSHMHTDHMVGLGSQDFYNRLMSNENFFLYCSKVTAVLLTNNRKYKRLSDKLKPLSMQQNNIITIPSSEDAEEKHVVVTLLPAGHCPGSVMFYFETQEKNVLYTGDFRLDLEDVKQFGALHYLNGEVKPLESLYLDTTFFSPDMRHLPTREEAAKKIVELAEEWLEKGSDCVISLHCAGNLGSEFLFAELHKKLDMKIHVSHDRYRMYKDIKDIETHVTVDSEATRIHACKLESPAPLYDREYRVNPRLPCNKEKVFKVRAIRPVSFWYADCVTKNDLMYGNFDNTYVRVCYSMHSSYTEILNMVKYLKPKRCHPIVKPQWDEELERMMEDLRRAAGADAYSCMRLQETGELEFEFSGPLVSEVSGTKEGEELVSCSRSLKVDLASQSCHENGNGTNGISPKSKRRKCDEATFPDEDDEMLNEIAEKVESEHGTPAKDLQWNFNFSPSPSGKIVNGKVASRSSSPQGSRHQEEDVTHMPLTDEEPSEEKTKLSSFQSSAKSTVTFLPENSPSNPEKPASNCSKQDDNAVEMRPDGKSENSVRDDDTKFPKSKPMKATKGILTKSSCKRWITFDDVKGGGDEHENSETEVDVIDFCTPPTSFVIDGNGLAENESNAGQQVSCTETKDPSIIVVDLTEDTPDNTPDLEEILALVPCKPKKDIPVIDIV